MQQNSSEIQARRGMLIELTAILDIRSATVRKLYGPVADDLVRNVGYRLRKSDELHLIDPRIDAKEYSFAYLGMDMDTLDHARKSLICTYIQQLITKIQLAIDGNNPLIQDVHVIVNAYPFELTEEESLFITAGVTAAIGLAEPVTLVNLPPKDITLQFLKENNIFTYILYDFDAWTVAALPDENGESLEDVGLSRIDNLTIIAARLAKLDSKAREVEQLVKSYQLPMLMEDISLLPWALLFELELLDPVFFTEYDETIAEKIMSVIEKSNSPIDIEVGLISEYCRILSPAQTKREQITIFLDRLEEIRKRLVHNFYSFNNDAEGSEYDTDEVRMLLAEQRFINDALSVFVPSQPATDYERLVDSKMSQFDTSLEYSDISEHHWNNLGVRCRRIVRDVPALSRSAYLLVAAEDVTDSNGVFRKKGSILPAATFFTPILEKVTSVEIEEFKKEMLE